MRPHPHAQVFCIQLPCCIYLRYKGQRAAQKFDSQEEAEEVAVAVRRAITLGQFDIALMRQRRKAAEEKAAAAVPTLEDFFSESVIPVWGSLAPETLKRYRVDFDNYIKPMLGDIPISEVSRDMTKKFVLNLLKMDARKRAPSEEGKAKEQRRPPREGLHPEYHRRASFWFE